MIKQNHDFKIALVGDSLSNGGAEKVHALLSQYFTSQGFQVYNCILVDEVTYQYSGTLLNLGKIGENSNGFYRKLSRLKAFHQFIKFNNFDVIIDFRLRNLPIRETIFSKFIYPKNVYYTIHSGILDFYFSKPKFWAKRLYANQNLVAVSKAIQGKIKNDFGFKNVYQLYNPIHLKEINALKSKSISLENPFILAVGRMNSDIKQFDKLIKTYAESILPINNIDLVFLGDGTLKNAYKNLVQELNLGEKVKFLSFQENPYSYFSNARFTVLCSKNEGFPNVLLESLACETPVISFDCFSGPNEIIQHNHNGLLVDNQNFDKLKLALNSLIENEFLYNTLKSNSKKSVEKFDIEIIGKKWLAFFQKNVS